MTYEVQGAHQGINCMKARGKFAATLTRFLLQMYAASLIIKARELKVEKKKKSDTLLFQMLPPSVAQQLKQTQQVRTRRIDTTSLNLTGVYTHTGGSDTPVSHVELLVKEIVYIEDFCYFQQIFIFNAGSIIGGKMYHRNYVCIETLHKFRKSSWW